MKTLRLHSSGSEVEALQKMLKESGFNPRPIDGEFGPGTESALMAFQKSKGLLDDGIAGPRTLSALIPENPIEVVSILPGVTVSIVARMFPHTPVANIETYLPFVLNGLEQQGLVDQGMVLVALATKRKGSVLSANLVPDLIPRPMGTLSTCTISVKTLVTRDLRMVSGLKAVVLSS